MNVSELTGAALDYWVARAENLEAPEVARITTSSGQTREWCQYVHHYYAPDDEGLWADYRPSADWAQGGPIIERECMEILYRAGHWRASILHVSDAVAQGSTMLEAAMRAYVISCFGATVAEVATVPSRDTDMQIRIYNRLRL